MCSHMHTKYQFISMCQTIWLHLFCFVGFMLLNGSYWIEKKGTGTNEKIRENEREKNDEVANWWKLDDVHNTPSHTISMVNQFELKMTKATNQMKIFEAK